MWDIRERGRAKSLRAARAGRRAAGAPPPPAALLASLRPPARLWVGALTIGGLLHALPAQGVEFGSGELRGSFDTTISHGVTFRVGERDDALTGLNSDDGGRNYHRGLVSNTSKVTGELELDYRNFGAFARINGFIDFENQNSRRARTPLSEEAKDLAGKDLEVLDLYVTGAFDAGDVPLDLRLGKHVLNWGESTFIQNGVNVINPFDVTKLRTPGAELRDALEPVALVSASAEPALGLSVEGFYQLDWKKTEIDPAGTYFSTNDYVGAGGDRAYLSDPRFASIITDMGGPAPGSPIAALTPAINADLAAFAQTPTGRAAMMDCRIISPAPAFAGSDCLEFHRDFLSVRRSPDVTPGDSGQWGVALRYLAEDLNDTEFGFYFVNHHSRLPLVSAKFGTLAGYFDGIAAAGAVSAPGSNTVTAITTAVTPPVTQAVTQTFTQSITAAVTASVPPGTPQSVIEQLVAAQLASPAVQQQIAAAIREQVQLQVAERISGVAGALAVDRYGDTARYFVEYPEDLQVFGVSFNTVLGGSGWALQGEYSFHPDTPLQRTEASLFAEGLAPLTRALTGDPLSPPELAAILDSQLQGYVERNVSQVQVTATKVFGPLAGADGAVFITEAAVTHVHDMPDKAVTPLDTGGIGDEIADATSFGYRAAARLDYNNAIGAARLSPYVQFQHDVNGSSPGPSGPFVEGRAVLTLGVGLNYLERWQGNLSYTAHAGGNNLLSDRDFVVASVKYSF